MYGPYIAAGCIVKVNRINQYKPWCRIISFVSHSNLTAGLYIKVISLLKYFLNCYSSKEIVMSKVFFFCFFFSEKKTNKKNCQFSVEFDTLNTIFYTVYGTK